ncbi:MAG: hypothetical protein ACE1Z9_09150, partial [Acidimicrobiia bacterium]
MCAGLAEALLAEQKTGEALKEYRRLAFEARTRDDMEKTEYWLAKILSIDPNDFGALRQGAELAARKDSS